MTHEVPSTVSETVLAKELSSIRWPGIQKLARLHLPELHKACVIVYGTPANEVEPAAIENLMRAAAERLDGRYQQGAELTFGLSAGMGHESSAVRRKMTADLFGRDPQTVKGNYEKKIYSGMARAIVNIVQGRPSRAPASVDDQTMSRDDALGRRLTVMHNLPASPPPMFGRGADVRALAKIIEGDERLIVIRGQGGGGKTRIAEAVAEKYGRAFGATRMFDFVFQVSAKARAFTFGEFADAVGRVLGNQHIAREPLVEDKAVLLTEELRRWRGLIVIDNAESLPVETLEQLGSLPVEVTCVFTSRKDLASLDAVVYPLKPLDIGSATELLENRLTRVAGPTLAEFPGTTANDILRLAGGNPLAIRWVASRFAKGNAPESILERMRDKRSDLLEGLFEDHWGDLGVYERSALMAVSLLGASADSRIVIAAIADDRYIGEDALATLVSYSLLDPVRESGSPHVRYSIHPLAREYARLQLEQQVDREWLVRRVDSALLGYILDRNQLQRGREEYRAIEDELPSVLLRLEYLQAANEDSARRTYVDYASAISVLLWGRGYWADRIRICQAASAAAFDIGDGIAATRHAATVGIVMYWQGRIDEAAEWAENARTVLPARPRNLQSALYRRLSALIEHRRGSTLEAVTVMTQVRDHIREAERGPDAEESIRVFADWVCAGQDGYLSGEVAVTQEIGIMYTDLGNVEEALRWLDRSATLAEHIGDTEGWSIALSHRGRALLEHDRQTAKQNFADALEMAKEVERQSTQGRALLGLAQIAIEEGDHAASQLLNDARLTFEQLGMAHELAACDRLASILNPEHPTGRYASTRGEP